MDIQVFIEKFAEEIEVEDTKKLSENTEFRDLDEWSSLAVLSLIALFDEEFEKEVGGKELKACVTLGDLYDLAVK